MSQPNMPNFTPNITLDRDDVVNLLLASIAMEEMGLAHIINAEGEKIQYALGTLNGLTGPPATLQEILSINESAADMLDTIFKKEIILESKMKAAANIPTMIGPTGATGATGPAGSVTSVNNILPDGAGNVILTIGDIPGGIENINGITAAPDGSLTLNADDVGAFPYDEVPSGSDLDSFITEGVYSSQGNAGGPVNGPLGFLQARYGHCMSLSLRRDRPHRFYNYSLVIQQFMYEAQPMIQARLGILGRRSIHKDRPDRRGLVLLGRLAPLALLALRGLRGLQELLALLGSRGRPELPG
ncbi:hypothetical protein NSQ26_02710 [Bacillus sp. FSL W7-1360]